MSVPPRAAPRRETNIIAELRIAVLNLRFLFLLCDASRFPFPTNSFFGPGLWDRIQKLDGYFFFRLVRHVIVIKPKEGFSRQFASNRAIISSGDFPPSSLLLLGTSLSRPLLSHIPASSANLAPSH